MGLSVRFTPSAKRGYIFSKYLFYCLSKNKPKPPKQAKNGKGNKNGQKQNGSFNSSGNSTSQKKPKGKDNN